MKKIGSERSIRIASIEKIKPVDNSLQSPKIMINQNMPPLIPSNKAIPSHNVIIN